MIRKILKVTAINLGLILMVGLLAELTFGGWIGNNYGTLVIPKDFKRRFDVSELYSHPVGTIQYIRDEHGLRGSYGDVDEIDILTIGGSTTNEIFLDEQSTWSAQLGQLFDASGCPMRVANAGVDGQSTVGHLKNFELWFPKIEGLKARYILAYIGINDFAVVQSGYLNKQDEMEAPRRKLKQYLLNNSALYTLFRNIRGMVRARQANLIHTGSSLDGATWVTAPVGTSVEDFEDAYAAPLNSFEQRVAQLIQAIRDFGASPILVTQNTARYRERDGVIYGRQGTTGEVDYGNYAGMAAVNTRTMKICAQENAICIDAARGVAFVDGDHYDTIHTTPAGSGKIAAFLHDTLTSQVSCRRPNAS